MASPQQARNVTVNFLHNLKESRKAKHHHSHNRSLETMDALYNMADMNFAELSHLADNSETFNTILTSADAVLESTDTATEIAQEITDKDGKNLGVTKKTFGQAFVSLMIILYDTLGADAAVEMVRHTFTGCAHSLEAAGLHPLAAAIGGAVGWIAGALKIKIGEIGTGEQSPWFSLKNTVSLTHETVKGALEGLSIFLHLAISGTQAVLAGSLIFHIIPAGRCDSLFPEVAPEKPENERKKGCLAEAKEAKYEAFAFFNCLASCDLKNFNEGRSQEVAAAKITWLANQLPSIRSKVEAALPDPNELDEFD